MRAIFSNATPWNDTNLRMPGLLISGIPIFRFFSLPGSISEEKGKSPNRRLHPQLSSRHPITIRAQKSPLEVPGTTQRRIFPDPFVFFQLPKRLLPAICSPSANRNRIFGIYGRRHAIAAFFLIYILWIQTDSTLGPLYVSRGFPGGW